MNRELFREAIEKIRVHLPDYLEEQGIDPNFNFTCIHPDHNDGNPSMGLPGEKVNFNCLGCGATGDIFTAAHYLEDKPLLGPEWITENVKYLGDKYGIEMPEYDLSETDLYEIDTYKAYKLASDYIASRENGDYKLFDKEMERRKWSPELLTELLIGTVENNKYKEYMKSLGFTVKFLGEIDLIRKDLFNSEHMIFTVCDEYGRPCGFAARNLTYVKGDKSSGIKYVNQKTTGAKCNIYKKGSRLYGFHRATKNSPPLYIFEGYADVITAIHHGIKNTCCIGGTAFTTDHVLALKESKQYDIVLALDSDEAGQNKTQRILDEKLAGHRDMKVRLVNFPEGQDPDDFIRDNGASEFHELTKYDAFAWRLDRYDELVEDPQDICDQMIPFIVNEPNHCTKEIMVNTLSMHTGVSNKSIQNELNRLDNVHDAELQQERSLILEKMNKEIRRDPENAQHILSMALNNIDNVSKVYNIDNFSKESWTEKIRSNKEKEETESDQDPGFKLDGLPLLEKVLKGNWREDVFLCIGGSPNTGKCFRGSTPILLADGSYKSIEDVVKDKDKHGVKMKDHKLVPAEFTDWIDSGELECFNVKTKHGLETDPSETHPYYTLDGWKQVKDLNVGDKIAIAKNYDCFDGLKGSINVKKSTLLGLLLSDGSLTSGVGFCNIDEELISLFKSICSDEYPGIGFNDRITEHTYYVHDKGQRANRVADFLKHEGVLGLNSHNKFIPSSIFKSDKETIAAFLGAFYACDGWVYVGDKKHEIGLTLCNKNMITQIRHLLLRFGICTSITESTSSYSGSEKRFNRYTLSIKDFDGIETFHRNIQIPLKEKQHKLDTLATKAESSKLKRGPYTSSFPSELWNNINKARIKKGMSHQQMMITITGSKQQYEKANNGRQERFKTTPVNKGKKKCNISQKLLQDIADILDDDFLKSLAAGDIYFDTITEIEPIGKHQCYDLTVEEDHNFIANDTVVHNTALMASLAYNIAAYNEDVCVIFHTIDDSAGQFLPRLVCIANDDPNLEINHVMNPVYYKRPDLLDRRSFGYQKVAELAQEGKLIVKDASAGGSLAYGESLVKYYQDKYPERQIIYFLDNFHKLNEASGMSEKDERIKIKSFSHYVKNNIAVKYHIPVIATVEYTKLEPTKRPTNNNVAESVSIEYDCNLMCHLYNDMHAQGAAAKLYHRTIVDGEEVRLPRIEMSIGKNKITSFKDKMYFDFYPASSMYRCCDRSVAEDELSSAEQVSRQSYDNSKRATSGGRMVGVN